MRPYERQKRKNYFSQGFWIGLAFGVLGAVVILGRDTSPEATLGEIETETSTETVTTIEPPPTPIAQG
jgi:hypothetical protein